MSEPVWAGKDRIIGACDGNKGDHLVAAAELVAFDNGVVPVGDSPVGTKVAAIAQG